MLFVSILIAGPAHAEPTSYFLDAPADLKAAIADALLLERPELRSASTATAADLVATLLRTPKGVELAVVRESVTLASRQMSETDGPEPVVRVAVLLISEASSMVSERSQPPRPAAVRADAPEPPAEAWGRFGAAFSTLAFGAPFTARLGAAIFGHADVDRFSLGARAVWAGALCCRLIGDGLEGDAAQLGLYAEGAMRVVSLGSAADLFALVNLGVVIESIDAQAAGVFAGPSPAESTTLAAFSSRLGLGLRGPIFLGFSWSVAVGTQLSAPRLLVKLPVPYDEGTSPLETGVLVPWGEVGVAVEFF